MLRWGILSTAKIGIERVIPAILDAENGIVAAIASRNKKNAQEVASRFAIPDAFGSYDELLACNEIDAVYIALPCAMHAEWAVKAANAGKHVLCEKPISLQADQIDLIIEARDRNGVLVSEAFMVTYHPQWHKVRSLLKDGAIGKLRRVQAVFTYNNQDEHNVRNIADLGGGALHDIGVYPAVTTRFATGEEPQRVSASIDRDKKFGTDIYASAVVEFPGFELSMMVSTQLALRQEMSFHGDNGWISVAAPFNAGLYDADVVTLHSADHSSAQAFRFPGVNQYRLQVEAFARAVADGEEAVFTLEDSKKNQKLIDAIYRAGESDQWKSV
ncbi:Gfo/Idh/MocA family oxidoreductase [Mariniblastus sp.]|nr:Gfo/Idh/MocA family oxidoreductase [Mariniblastus sp.]